MNENELKDELRRELQRAPVWELEPDHVARKATGFRRRRRALSALTILVAVGVTTGSVVGLARLGNGPGGGPAATGATTPAPVDHGSSPGAPAPGPASVAEFSCTADGIQPADVIVAAGPAGVMVAADDASGVSGGMTFTLGDAGTNVSPDGGVVAYPGGGRAWPLAPGDYEAKCVPSDEFDPQSAPGSTLHVTDPSGYWVSNELDCKSAFSSFVDFAPNGSTLEDAVHSALDGYAKDGDVIRRVGYPDAALPQYSLDREGRMLVRATIRDHEDGGWVPDEVTGCGHGGASGDVQPPIVSR